MLTGRSGPFYEIARFACLCNIIFSFYLISRPPFHPRQLECTPTQVIKMSSGINQDSVAPRINNELINITSTYESLNETVLTPILRQAFRAQGWAIAVVYLGLAHEPAMNKRWTSQDGQDRTVVDLFKGKRNGFFVDLAAMEAVDFSNTLTLEQEYLWDGICIEANPKYYAMLYHRKCLVVQATVGHSDNQQVEFAFRDGLGGIIGNGFDNDARNQGVQVTTVSLASIFQTLAVPQEIDYMSLDIEGAEEWVFESFPWDRYRVSLFTVERPKTKMKAILQAQGYHYVRNHGDYGDEMWIHESFPDLQGSLVRMRDKQANY